MWTGASTYHITHEIQPARFSLHIPFILPWVLSFFLAVMVDTRTASGSKMMPSQGWFMTTDWQMQGQRSGPCVSPHTEGSSEPPSPPCQPWVSSWARGPHQTAPKVHTSHAQTLSRQPNLSSIFKNRERAEFLLNPEKWENLGNFGRAACRAVALWELLCSLAGR